MMIIKKMIYQKIMIKFDKKILIKLKIRIIKK